MSWRLVFRAGGRVERSTLPTLDDALDALERRTRAAAAGPGLDAVSVPTRRWEPADRVAARGELRGPERWRPAVRAGLDVRGDGSVVAWTGAPRREALDPADGEDAYAALRRAVTA